MNSRRIGQNWTSDIWYEEIDADIAPVDSKILWDDRIQSKRKG
jgi:hypothetical protein